MTVTPKKLFQTAIPSGKNIFNPAKAYNSVSLPLTSTTTFILYANDANSLDARISTLNNDNSVTYGTTCTAFSGSFISLGQFTAVKLTSTSVFIAFQDVNNSNYGTGVIATISGNNITFGSKFVFFTGSTVNISATMISSTNVFISYAGTSNYGNGVVASVSGSTISYGAPSMYSASTAVNATTTCCTLDSTHVFINYSVATGSTVGIVAVISGTTISSYGSSANLCSSSVSYIKSIALNSNQVLCVYYNATQFNVATIISISGTTITYNPIYKFNSNSVAGNFDIGLIDSTHVLITYVDSANYQQSIIAIITGTSINFGIPLQHENTTTGSTTSIAIMNSNTFILTTHTNIVNNYYGLSMVLQLVGNNNLLLCNTPTLVYTGLTGGHSEISSFYTYNFSNTTTVFYFYVGGTNSVNLIKTLSVTSNTSGNIVLTNSPIILNSGENLYVGQSGVMQSNITCYGLELS